MLNKKPSAILFDLDGTIADTALDLSATLNHLLTLAGRQEISHDQVRNMVGEGALALIIKGFSHNGEKPTQKELDILFDQYLEYYRNHIADHTVIFPGALQMLKTLKEQNIPLAICTNKNIDLTHLLLKELDIIDYFATITCGDSFPYKKPDPRHLFSTCKLMNVDPTDAIMVGDSINDIEAARTAKILSVGVTFGYTKTSMTDLSPDLIINHFDEFFDAINQFKPRL